MLSAGTYSGPLSELTANSPRNYVTAKMHRLRNRYGLFRRELQAVAAMTPGVAYELLVITADTSFFANLQYLATARGWTVRWARSVRMATETFAGQPIPVILYDWRSVSDDWLAAIDRLKLIPDRPCIILAAGRVDEDLWRRALGRQVYDVVSRAGLPEHLLATLRFAWDWWRMRRDPAVADLTHR
jgi:DNA-binding NtrC family response regulator